MAASASRRSRALPEQTQTYSITGAQAPHSQGVDARMRSYAVKMALRLVFILLAVVTEGWLRWSCVAAAMVLPWVAVVLANGSDRAEVRDVSAYTDPARRPLPAAQAPEPGEDPGRAAPTVIEGEYREGHGVASPAEAPTPGPHSAEEQPWT